MLVLGFFSALSYGNMVQVRLIRAGGFYNEEKVAGIKKKFWREVLFKIERRLGGASRPSQSLG